MSAASAASPSDIPSRPAPAEPSTDIDAGWQPSHNRWLIALTVTLATFMEVLDTSIANVSLPHIAGNLSVSQDESTWVLTSYLVANAVILPISGWMSSKFGRKRFYMTSVALFTISSFLCGIAPNLGALVFFRILQGIGGGGLAPSEQAILADTFTPEKRGVAMALYGMAVVMAPAIGPTLGGYITDNYSWRWIFFINVPVGILSLFLSNRMVEDPPHLKLAKKNAGSLDWVGLMLIAIGLGSFEVVLDKGQEEDWFHSSFVVGFMISAVVALTSFVLWELKQEKPIVDLRLYKSRNFAAANMMMLMLGISLYGTTVLLPQFLQTIMHYDATQAGMVLSPGAVLIVLMMPFIGQAIGKVDARKMIAFGFIVMSSSLFYMTAKISTGLDFWTAVKLRSFQSIALAFLFVPIQTLVYVGIPPAKNNSVSGIVNLSRNIGGDVGIALVTTLIVRRAQVHQALLTEHITKLDPAFNAQVSGMTNTLVHAGLSGYQAQKRAYGQIYFQVQQQATTLAYVDALYVVAVMCALMVPLVFLMDKPKPGMKAAAH